MILPYAASPRGSYSEDVYALPPGSVLLVGRAPTSHIKVDDDRVADHRLSSDSLGVNLIGIDVVNGTTVNGWRVVGPVLLGEGDVISFGGVPATFHESQAGFRETRSDVHCWGITPEAPIGYALRGATADVREGAGDRTWQSYSSRADVGLSRVSAGSQS